MSGMRTNLSMSMAAGRADLRKFGLIFSCVLSGLFYFLIPWLKSADRPLVVLWIALALAGLALLLPVALRPLFVLATLIGTVLGAINNRLVLSLIFFVIFTPMAVVMRILLKKDSMRFGFDPQAVSYRVLRENKDMVKNKEKAF